ncbi:MAG: hypothetical protein ACI4JJ_00570 [Huintestinicola sp.]
MKIKNVFAAVAAAAMAVSMVSVSASAADWSQASYADDDPATVNIISSDENGVTFTATADAATAKCRITLDKVLANPEDAANIKSMTWKVTYNGFTSDMDAGNGVGGGTYAATCNSAGYWISPDYDDDGNAYWGSSTYSVEDSVKYLLASQVPSADGELVFMDWSGYNLVSNNITVTISDLKIFDAAGNEIEQLAYGAYGAAAEEAPAAEANEDAAAEEAAPAEEEAAPAEEEAAPAEEAAEEPAVEETTAAVVEDTTPAADSDTTSSGTGNTAAASIAAVMAVAAAAAVVSKRK